MTPSSFEFSAKPGPLDSHTRPGSCPQAPWEKRGNSLDISLGEGPTWTTVGNSRMVGTIVQNAFEGLLYLLQVHAFQAGEMGAATGH